MAGDRPSSAATGHLSRAHCVPGTVRALGTTQGMDRIFSAPQPTSLSRLAEAHRRLSLLSGRLNEGMNEPKTRRATRREGQRRREGTREKGRSGETAKGQRSRDEAEGARRGREGGNYESVYKQGLVCRACYLPISACLAHECGRKREDTKDEEGKEQDDGGGGARERRREASPVGRKGRLCFCRAAGCPHPSTHLGWASPCLHQLPGLPGRGPEYVAA